VISFRRRPKEAEGHRHRADEPVWGDLPRPDLFGEDTARVDLDDTAHFALAIAELRVKHGNPRVYARDWMRDFDILRDLDGLTARSDKADPGFASRVRQCERLLSHEAWLS
jgi:hypothetical protein